MKHILPILTITTLAAAASAADATAAAPAGLSYNRVGLSYDFKATKGYSLDASAVVGHNILVSASTKVGGDHGNGGDSVAVGYLFSNLFLGTDLTVQIGSDESYGLGLRRALGAGFEASLGLSSQAFSSSTVAGSGVITTTPKGHATVWSAEVAYNFNKQYSLALGYARANATGAVSDSKNQTTVTARYSF